MLELENPQDRAMTYALHIRNLKIERKAKRIIKANWQGMLVPRQVKLATDQRNPLKMYY
jgi:hypothetical protein